MTVFFKDGREVILTNAVKATSKGEIVHFTTAEGAEVGAFNLEHVNGWLQGTKNNEGAYDHRGVVDEGPVKPQPVETKTEKVKT
jgi:hypothetical protein